LVSEEPGAKLERIRAIHTAGFSPRAYILRRRLGTHSTAAEVEAAIIDVLLRWKVPLTNLVRGAGVENGIRLLDGIVADHRALPLSTTRATVLVNIGRTWSEGMALDDLWDAARKWWQCRPANRNPAPNLLLAEAQGIVRGAWTIASPPHRLRVTWEDLDDRRRTFLGPQDEFRPFEACCFDGEPDAEWAILVGRHTRYPVLPRAYGSAFRYLNC